MTHIYWLVDSSVCLVIGIIIIIKNNIAMNNVILYRLEHEAQGKGIMSS